ncbi:MAG: hypothetical protein GY705_20020 [Bacteroidetes bacterium]|nr:hypothetical protein [Bacteroidota bacterium]
MDQKLRCLSHVPFSNLYQYLLFQAAHPEQLFQHRIMPLQKQPDLTEFLLQVRWFQMKEKKLEVEKLPFLNISFNFLQAVF